VSSCADAQKSSDSSPFINKLLDKYTPLRWSHCILTCNVFKLRVFVFKRLFTKAENMYIKDAK